MSGPAGGPEDTVPTAASRVAAVVVNFESGTALTECLRTLVSESPAEVVVVDNGSSDGSVATVGRDFPAVEVVVPGRNLGYGAAANRGAAATTAELILVCNPDLSVHHGALAALVAVLDQQPDVAVTGPLIRTPTGDRYPSARRFPSLIDAGGHALLGLFVPNNRFTRNYQRSDM
ncbi:MAG: glycosyltransferase, partial [Acidimicrobiales bacterium]|nr:glycosyltransferase [Acidimicrobiales bacterium]